MFHYYLLFNGHVGKNIPNFRFSFLDASTAATFSAQTVSWLTRSVSHFYAYSFALFSGDFRELLAVFVPFHVAVRLELNLALFVPVLS